MCRDLSDSDDSFDQREQLSCESAVTTARHRAEKVNWREESSKAGNVQDNN